MIRYRSNKQAFIIAALVILLCLVCLTGATLALFTNDPNDGTIGIVTTSGDVEIDIVDTSGASLQNRALSFVTTSGEKDSKDVLFEPGAKFYTQEFMIQNTGDIPVNFHLSVGKDNIVEVIGGKEEKVDLETFFNTFEIWIVEKGQGLDTAERMEDFIVKGLQPNNSSSTYRLFIKMKETVGNEFQGKTYTGIGVTVYAVQGNVNLN
jgi:hypothetical protein